MQNTLRLDRFISNQTSFSRNDVKNALKRGEVCVNGIPVRSGDVKISPEKDRVTLSGREIGYREYVYIMMNKPKGVLSATEDKIQKTAVDLLPEELRKRGVFPAGRLDRDSTGFLLLTDDGEFAHRVISPKSHIDKTYIVTTDAVPQNAAEAFEKGITLASGEQCMRAKYTQLSLSPPVAEIVIHEGKYHQIKRMLGTLCVGVNELKRVQIGSLPLDESLNEGEFRILDSDEVLRVFTKV